MLQKKESSDKKKDSDTQTVALLSMTTRFPRMNETEFQNNNWQIKEHAPAGGEPSERNVDSEDEDRESDEEFAAAEPSSTEATEGDDGS